MACSTCYINSNLVHASTLHQDHTTSWDPTYLLVLQDAMDSDDSNNDDFDGYVHLQDYTHYSINLHTLEETTDDQDIKF